jgi:transposase
MKHYVGLDVSQQHTAVCVIDQDGKKIWEGKCATDPHAITETLCARRVSIERIGMETGPLAVWLFHALLALGMPIVCLHARHVHAALAVQLNKTDGNDAAGIAQLIRSGWYRPVQVKSLRSHELRLILIARAKMVSIRTALYNQIRGVLKTFGVVLPAGRNRAFEQLVEQSTPASALIGAAIAGLMDTWRGISHQVRKLDYLLEKMAGSSEVTRRLMSVPGVGPTTAIAFVAAVDDPARFRRMADLGAYLGLTPRKYQSGEVDRNGAISKCGCRLTRYLLVEAASAMLMRSKSDNRLRRWAGALLPRIGRKKTLVALARKLATVLLSMWRNQVAFRPG